MVLALSHQDITLSLAKLTSPHYLDQYLTENFHCLFGLTENLCCKVGEPCDHLVALLDQPKKFVVLISLFLVIIGDIRFLKVPFDKLCVILFQEEDVVVV